MNEESGLSGDAPCHALTKVFVRSGHAWRWLWGASELASVANIDEGRIAVQRNGEVLILARSGAVLDDLAVPRGRQVRARLVGDRVVALAGRTLRSTRRTARRSLRGASRPRAALCSTMPAGTSPSTPTERSFISSTLWMVATLRSRLLASRLPPQEAFPASRRNLRRWASSTPTREPLRRKVNSNLSRLPRCGECLGASADEADERRLSPRREVGHGGRPAGGFTRGNVAVRAGQSGSALCAGGRFCLYFRHSDPRSEATQCLPPPQLRGIGEHDRHTSGRRDHPERPRDASCCARGL